MKLTINIFKLLFLTSIFVLVNSTQAELYYTTAEYRKLYNEKYVLQLEIKHFKEKTKNERNLLNSKIQDLKLNLAKTQMLLKDEKKDNKNNQINSNNTIAKLNNKIGSLNTQLSNLNKKNIENKNLAQLRITALEKNIDILKNNASSREKNLINEKQKMQTKLLAELDKLKDQLQTERKKNLLEKNTMLAKHKRELTACNGQALKLNTELQNLKKINLANQTKLDSLGNQAKSLEEKLKKEIANGKMKLKRYKDKIVINMNNKILFASGSADLKTSINETLKNLAEILSKYQNNSFRIEGHTDNVPIRTLKFKNNWHLSSARALSVLDRLLDNSKLDPANFSATGRGQFQPIAPNDSTDNRSLNRRVDIVLIPKK